MNVKWDLRFLRLAKEVSTWSKDPSTQVGAVIANEKKVISLGYNGFPEGMDDSEEFYLDREMKLSRIIHAEQNAILNANIPVKGFTLYVWPMMPCAPCSLPIIQAGISRVVSVTTSEEVHARWHQSFSRSQGNFSEANVGLKFYHPSDLD